MHEYVCMYVGTYGVVWCGVVWYGMVWYRMVWYRMYVCMYLFIRLFIYI